MTPEENALLTETGPGTPCGELMRRYWEPAALSEELPPGGAPVPIRLLGEDLVLFRDERGRPGLLGLHCAHRGADLSYGRLEDGGLRCIYHGWLYDVQGRCLEQPGEPAGSTFHERIHPVAYPCREQGGAIFAYLGPGEPPLLPGYEFLTVPDEHVLATKALSECNYLQALDGGLDPAHVYFLHRALSNNQDPRAAGIAPAEIRTESEDFGVRIYMVRPLEGDQSYVGITNYIVPSLNAFSGGSSRPGYTVNWFVPLDDTHHWKFTFNFDRENPVDREGFREGRAADDQYRPLANRSNRFLQDRALMKEDTFCGIPIHEFQAHDMCATEGAGPIQDRSTEHLTSTDRGIVAARRLLLQGIRAVQEGRDPPHIVRDPAANQFDHLVTRNDVLPNSVDWRTYWRAAAEPATARS